MRLTDTSDLWWKTAVFYCVDIETFMDWNDDGIGDLAGLAHRMDYLAELGITCLWLMPFYPSPDQDDGYDISDFYAVDPRYGNFGDLVEVIRTAKDRGIRVIVDLVVNHTSDQHPWFQKSRSSRENEFRDWYVWRDEPPAKEEPTVFPGEEASVWELDETTGQYYLHSFYRHQPDLNVGNPRVREEIEKIMGFWLQLGVAGFRVDAVPFLLDRTGILPDKSDLTDPMAWLRSLRAFLGRRSGEAILLGEANLPHKQQLAYFGDSDADGLTMQFDFVVMQNLYLSLVRRDARPLVKALNSRPELAVESQFANFLRNHDELTLDKLTDKQREEVFAELAPEESMRIYDRGIVRRLPPMLHGDPRRIRLAYSLMFTMPGTPVLFYGEELGLGDEPRNGGRQAVRVPMQWTDGENGGFSRADSTQLVARVVDRSYSPEHVNASQQRNDPGSMLHFMRRLIERYRASAEIGWGSLTVLEQPDHTVLAHSLAGAEGRMIALHNLGEESASVTIRVDGCGEGDELADLLVDGALVPVSADGTVTIALDGYGYRWFRVREHGTQRLR